MSKLILQTDISRSELHIGSGILASKIAPLCRTLTKRDKVAIVTDSTVGPLYGKLVTDALSAAGFVPSIMEFPAGEASKNLSTVNDIYTFLAEHQFSRSDPIIALGGGVVGDIVGFAAATFLRGIHSIQIPTTLLAQVDSSVGGKCGVDLPCGKNLVGAFNQPDAVLIDTDLLQTLSPEIFSDGMAEVIKYGCIFDEDLFTLLEQESAEQHITEIVERCVTHKRNIVQQDEHDLGPRMLLNFGHTVGHAIETCGNYTTHSHGQSVSRGMVAASRIGVKLGITPTDTTDRLKAILDRYSLHYDVPYSSEALSGVLTKDKKFLSGKLNFILLNKIGNAVIHPLTASEIFDLLPVIY